MHIKKVDYGDFAKFERHRLTAMTFERPCWVQMTALIRYTVLFKLVRHRTLAQNKSHDAIKHPCAQSYARSSGGA
jgi:hypothetical protein